MVTFSASLALCAGNSTVPVISPHKGQWRGALMFSLICAWINDWVNNREAGDLRGMRAHYDVIVMGYSDLCRGRISTTHVFSFATNDTNCKCTFLFFLAITDHVKFYFEVSFAWCNGVIKYMLFLLRRYQLVFVTHLSGYLCTELLKWTNTYQYSIGFSCPMMCWLHVM